MKKTALLTLCLLALALALTACGGGSTSAPSPSAPAQLESVSVAASVAEVSSEGPESSSPVESEPGELSPATYLDEELAVGAYCLALGEDPGQYTPEYREEIELEYTSISGFEGVFTGNRGDATTVVVDGVSATVVDTGSTGEMTFVRIVDLSSNEVVFDTDEQTPSAASYTMSDEEAARSYALAYGFSPEEYTVEGMQAMDYNFTRDSDNQVRLDGNRGGGWTIVRVGQADTVVDFGSLGDPFLVTVVDNAEGQLVYQSPMED